MPRFAQACLVALTALALVAAAGAGRGRTVVEAPARVLAVGLQSGRLFWVLDRCTDVVTRPVDGGRAVTLGDARSSECDYNDDPDVAFASGGRALWSSVGGGNSVYADVLTAAPGRSPKQLEQVVGSGVGGDGDYLVGAAGGGSTLVYAVVSVSMPDTCIDPGTPCDRSIRSSRTMRVVERRAVRVPGVPPARVLAAGGGRVAVDVAADHDGGRLVPAGRVEVRDAVSGRLTAAVRPGGTVLELALSGEVLAVLVRRGGRKAIERYAPVGGRALGRTPVYGNAHALAVSGRRTVFATGRTIRQIGLGATGIVARAARTVVALAVEGRRLVWAENDVRRGRVVLALL